MMPFFKSMTELMVITKSKDKQKTSQESIQMKNIVEDSGQRKRYLRLEDERQIKLPPLPKSTKVKWLKSKDAISNFINDLDYNNQIQSSYDITLIERQIHRNHQDAA